MSMSIYSCDTLGLNEKVVRKDDLVNAEDIKKYYKSCTPILHAIDFFEIFDQKAKYPEDIPRYWNNISCDEGNGIFMRGKCITSAFNQTPTPTPTSTAPSTPTPTPTQTSTCNKPFHEYEEALNVCCQVSPLSQNDIACCADFANELIMYSGNDNWLDGCATFS